MSGHGAPDSRPCQGDAFRMAFDGHGQTCADCCRGESHGGKCAGENVVEFVAGLWEPLVEWLTDVAMARP